MKIQKDLVQVLPRDNGGFHGVQDFTPLILGWLLHTLEDGICATLFLFVCLFVFKFIYLFLAALGLRCWVFVAARELSLVVASRGFSSLWCTGFSLWWLLLFWSSRSRLAGFSSCGTWAQ